MSFKYCVHLHVGYSGMDSYEFIEFDEKPTEDELDDICWSLAVEHAASYGYYPRCDYNVEELEDDEDGESDMYVDSIEGWAEPYDAEKHDMYSFNGTPVFMQL